MIKVFTVREVCLGNIGMDTDVKTTGFPTIEMAKDFLENLVFLYTDFLIANNKLDLNNAEQTKDVQLDFTELYLSYFYGNGDFYFSSSVGEIELEYYEEVEYIS